MMEQRTVTFKNERATPVSLQDGQFFYQSCSIHCITKLYKLKEGLSQLRTDNRSGNHTLRHWTILQLELVQIH